MPELAYLLDLFGMILTWMIIIRVLLTWFPQVDERNPVVAVLAAIVDPILAPFRRILPTFGGMSFAPVLAIIVINLVTSFLVSVLQASSGAITPTFLLQSVLAAVLHLFITISLVFIVLVGIRLLMIALQSDPFHPGPYMLRQMTDPLVAPFRRFLPGRQQYGNPPAVLALLVYIAIFIALNELGTQLIARI